MATRFAVSPRLRSALIPVGLVVVICLIVASAFWPHSPGDDVGGPSALATTGASDPTGEPVGLVGTEWQLVDGTRGSERLETATSRRAVLRFNGKGGMSGNDGCNYFQYDVTIGAGMFDVGKGSSTLVACGAGLPGSPGRSPSSPVSSFDGQEAMRDLAHTVRWSIAGRCLTLTTSVSSLVFDVASSIFPSVQSGHPGTVLDTGHRGTGDYRVTWTDSSEGTVALGAEWREEPGESMAQMFGSLGKNEWPASIWACDSFTIGADRYVYGFALAGTTEATVTDNAGHTVGTLTVSSPGWVQDRVAYHGWVAGAAAAKTLVVTTRTATGEETKPACSVIH